MRRLKNAWPTRFINDVPPCAATTSRTAWLARKDFGKGFPHLVALCIKYRFGNSRRHAETGYLFSIGRRDASGNVQYITDSKSGSLKPPELVLMPLGSYQGRLRRDWRPPR